MIALWIVLGILSYLALAVMIGRFVRRRTFTHFRDEVMQEVLPGATTGEGRERPVSSGRLEWTDASNLTALDRWASPATSREAHSADAPAPGAPASAETSTATRTP